MIFGFRNSAAKEHTMPKPSGKHIYGLPKGKHIFGTVKVGEKGQIVIPKEAREVFGIKPGDSLLVLGDKTKGLALVRTQIFDAAVDEVFR